MEPDRPRAVRETAVGMADFAANPASYVHPERLRQALPSGIPLAIRDALVSSPRFQARLSARLSRVYGLPAWTPHAEEAAQPGLVLLRPEQRRRVVALAGTLWFAKGLRDLLEARILREYAAVVGEPEWRFAISAVELAPDGQPLPLPNWLDKAIEIAGTACVAAWLDRQPAPLRSRLRLAFPKASPFLAGYGRPVAEFGPAIVDRALASAQL